MATLVEVMFVECAEGRCMSGPCPTAEYVEWSDLILVCTHVCHYEVK